MFRLLRKLHKWIGLSLGVFLMLLAVTGVILSQKGNWGWVRPSTASSEYPLAQSKLTLSELLSKAQAKAPEEFPDDSAFERIEIHPDKGVVKFLSTKDYQEVQLCATTGEVLARGQRFDQLAEDIHDLRWFDSGLTGWVLPWVGVGLMCLSISGVYMACVPVVRRWKHYRTSPPK